MTDDGRVEGKRDRRSEANLARAAGALAGLAAWWLCETLARLAGFCYLAAHGWRP